MDDEYLHYGDAAKRQLEQFRYRSQTEPAMRSKEPRVEDFFKPAASKSSFMPSDWSRYTRARRSRLFWRKARRWALYIISGATVLNLFG